MRISDWSSDVCSSDLLVLQPGSAQRLDLVGEPAVVAGVVQLDVGEPAVDVAKARADVAGRRAGVRPHTLPEFRFLLRAVEGDGLGGCHLGDEPIVDKRPGYAAQDRKSVV